MYFGRNDFIDVIIAHMVDNYITYSSNFIEYRCYNTIAFYYYNTLVVIYKSTFFTKNGSKYSTWIYDFFPNEKKNIIQVK